jgi:arylsulfatase A-like enzyme
MNRAGLTVRLALMLAGLTPFAGCSDGLVPITRVVVVTLDTMRADRLGCYGYENAATPNLDRVAAEGVVFENAVSPVPTTLPSHSTIFTGLYPQDHGVRYNLVYRLGPEAVTLAELLRDAGFQTAGFPSAFVLDRKFGLDQGFETYTGGELQPNGTDNDSLHNGLRAGAIVDSAIAWFDGRSETEKQFAWLHFYDAHAPYVPPFPFSSSYRDRPYDGEIAYVDLQFGRLLERLESSPEWEKTLLIVVGDHGEGLHQHRERFHANLIYETTQRVPLIIHGVGVRAGRIVEPVTLADLTPTVLDLLGLSSPVEMRGISLAGALRGAEPPRRDIYFESQAGALNYGWHELRGLRYGPWKLIESGDPELFDLSADPGELNDLASLETARVADLTDALRDLGEPMGAAPSAELAHDPVTDPETERFLASLGYVAGGSGGSAADAVNPRDLIDLEPELMAGQLSIGAGDWATVEELCRYVLERDPKNKWALGNLVGALMWTDRFEDAQGVSAEIVRIYPERPQGYTLLARAYKAGNMIEEAHLVLAQGLERAGESATLRYLHIVAGFDLGLPGLCIEPVPSAVERYPDSALLRVLQARCEIRSGAVEQALDTITRAIELGFTAVEKLEEAEDFEELVNHPRYRELISVIDESGPDDPAAVDDAYDPSQLQPF